MNLEPGHIEQIKLRFVRMQTKEDFLGLINYCRAILSREPASLKPVKLSMLNWYADYRKSGPRRYQQFSIKKKNGGARTIQSPAPGLKSIQRSLNLILQVVFEPHDRATGFCPGRSVMTNASLHVAKNYVYNVDLKDFFPSIGLYRIKKRLEFPPFNLSGEREPLAYLIANLCTHPLVISAEEGQESRPVLPQGAPTSPILTNIISFRLDKKLSGLAKRFGLTYSRYADDITFSSPHNVYQDGSEFITELNRVVVGQGFTVNNTKTRLQKSAYRQEVTGIVVNEKTNARRRSLKEIRFWLHVWEEYGYAAADKAFRPYYFEDKGHLRKGNPTLANVLQGKLLYLKMIRGESDRLYLKYSSIFNELTGKGSIMRENQLERVLDLLEKDGYDEAMKLFDRFK